MLYFLQVTTADVKNAGTNADIKVKLFEGLDAKSDARKSNQHELDTKGYDDFEQGDSDCYAFFDAEFRPPMSVEIYMPYDGKGGKPGWKFGGLEVTAFDVPSYEEFKRRSMRSVLNNEPFEPVYRASSNMIGKDEDGWLYPNDHKDKQGDPDAHYLRVNFPG